MKAFAIVSATVLLLSGSALAQPGGVVGVFTEATGSGDCFLVEQVGNINSVWIVHQSGPNAEGARFRVSHNWSATFVNATFNGVIYITMPDIFGGDFFGYAGCQTTPHWIMRIDFLPIVPTPPCIAEFHVVPDPDAASGEIEVFDCDSNTLFASPGLSWVVVNLDNTCACHADPPVGTEESTWGRIKGLYR